MKKRPDGVLSVGLGSNLGTIGWISGVLGSVFQVFGNLCVGKGWRGSGHYCFEFREIRTGLFARTLLGLFHVNYWVQEVS
jgi:hypothetical protein